MAARRKRGHCLLMERRGSCIIRRRTAAAALAIAEATALMRSSSMPAGERDKVRYEKQLFSFLTVAESLLPLG